VYRGPYEYSSPQSDRDFLPQSEPLVGRVTPHPQPAGD
jgi:hypothetical protein